MTVTFDADTLGPSDPQWDAGDIPTQVIVPTSEEVDSEAVATTVNPTKAAISLE